MHRLVRTGVLPCALALASLSVSFAPAIADLGVTTAYQIESHQQYCAIGGTNCVPSDGPPNLAQLRFALVELYKLSPNTQDPAGGSVSLPDVMLAKCAGPHWMDAKGNVHAPTMFVLAGPTDMHLDGGTIQGKVHLSHARASDTNATSTVTLFGSDPVSGDRATVTGTEVVNNPAGLRVSGGFTITLDGQQFDEIVAGPDANEEAMPTPMGQGHMSCWTGSDGVTVPGAPPPTFMNEVNAPPGK